MCHFRPCAFSSGFFLPVFAAVTEFVQLEKVCRRFGILIHDYDLMLQNPLNEIGLESPVLLTLWLAALLKVCLKISI